MTCRMNGHHMGITYGEGGTVAETLSIGRSYCHKHLASIPKLSREQLLKLGCVFPAPSPKTPPHGKTGGARHTRPITEDDVARILAGYDKGRTVRAIAVAVKRAAPVVRKVLIAHGRDTHRFCGNPSPLRIRIVEMLSAGKSVREVHEETGAAFKYVQNIASNLRRASAQRKEAA